MEQEHSSSRGLADDLCTAHVDGSAAVGELKFVAAIALACAQRSHERQRHTEYWYSVRLEPIKDAAKRHGIWPEVSAIIANGSATRPLEGGSYHYEPPTYAQQLNRAEHRAQAAEAKVEALARERDALAAKMALIASRADHVANDLDDPYTRTWDCSLENRQIIERSVGSLAWIAAEARSIPSPLPDGGRG